MATATKNKIYVGQLPPYQQKIMLTARTMQASGIPVKTDTLAVEVEGSTNTPQVAKVNTAIEGLTTKGCWMWNKQGKPLPGDYDFVVWPETAAGTPSPRSAGNRTASGTEATRQAERDFVHTIQGGYAELPFESQIRLKEAVRGLEDLVMQEQG